MSLFLILCHSGGFYYQINIIYPRKIKLVRMADKWHSVDWNIFIKGWCEMSDNVSPRPWKWDDKSDLVDANGNKIISTNANDKYFITAVNEYDGLVCKTKELEKQKQFWFETWEQEKELSKGQKDSLIAEVDKLKQENEKLREALKKCDPGGIWVERDCEKCNQGVGQVYCNFCSNLIDDGHAADCEYVRLCGGGNDVQR